uniref:Uncharacterized protein n=1 Tax=Arundo donax TaxID=35708 RepID=A0A0A9F9P0_ARUDO
MEEFFLCRLSSFSYASCYRLFQPLCLSTLFSFLIQPCFKCSVTSFVLKYLLSFVGHTWYMPNTQ